MSEKYLPVLALSILITLAFAAHAAIELPSNFVSSAKCGSNDYDPPKSSALSECTECSIASDGVLSCSCPSESGEFLSSTLKVFTCSQNMFIHPVCADEIKLADGALQCRPMHEQSVFSNRCYNCTQSGTMMHCTCWYEEVKYQSDLDTSDCTEPVQVCKGLLTCGACASDKSSGGFLQALRSPASLAVLAGLGAASLWYFYSAPYR